MTFCALHFPGQEAAEEAAARLRSEGFRVEIQLQPDESVVVAVPIEGNPSARVDVTLSRMALVADEWGGSLLGYGELSSVPAWVDAHH